MYLVLMLIVFALMAQLILYLGPLVLLVIVISLFAARHKGGTHHAARR